MFAGRHGVLMKLCIPLKVWMKGWVPPSNHSFLSLPPSAWRQSNFVLIRSLLFPPCFFLFFFFFGCPNRLYIYSVFLGQTTNCVAVRGWEGMVLRGSLRPGCSHTAQRWCYAAGCSLLHLRPVVTGLCCLCRQLHGPTLCSCLPVDEGTDG